MTLWTVRKMDAILALAADLMTFENIFERTWMVPLESMYGDGRRLESSGRSPRNKYLQHDRGRLFWRGTRRCCGGGAPCHWGDTVFCRWSRLTRS